MSTQATAIAQRSVEKLRFDHKDMDYYFAWILGRAIYEGSDPEECFATAGEIRDGDAASWRSAWLRRALRVAGEAATALEQGDRQAARRAYLRACSYYRAPLFLMAPDDPGFAPAWRRMRACFRLAAALSEPPIEQIAVPYQGRSLPGYRWGAQETGRRTPTLIVIGGIETFAEDCYFMLGPSGAQRGYNLITVDLPGQGATPYDGLVFEARMGPALAAVVEAALARDDVDPARLAVFGFSWGGHVVLKGAEHDQAHGQRIKAVVANPAMPDVFRAARAQQANHSRGDAIGWLVIQQIAWRMGLRISRNPGDIARRVAKAYDYFVHGKAQLSSIACPVLCLAGEAEAPITLEVARASATALPNPNTRLRIFTAAENGAMHCQVNNLALPNGVIFDWLDELFP